MILQQSGFSQRPANQATQGGNSSRQSSSQGDRNRRGDNFNNNRPPAKRDERRQDRRDDSRDRDSPRRDDPPRKPPSPNREAGKKRKLSPVSTTRSSHHSSERDTHRENLYSFVSQERDVIELKQRYHKLHIPKDFTQVKCLWSSLSPNSVSVNYSLPVECSTSINEESVSYQFFLFLFEIFSMLIKVFLHIFPLILKNVANLLNWGPENGLEGSNVVYCAKVMLFSGSKLTPSKSAPPTKSTHLSTQLQFIVGRKDRSELFCIGGAWSKELDGGDPASNSSVLIRTAIRTFRDFTGHDLSYCQQWYPFMEVQYSRPTHQEITVVYLPAIWDHVSISLHLSPNKSNSAPLESNLDGDSNSSGESRPDQTKNDLVNSDESAGGSNDNITQDVSSGNSLNKIAKVQLVTTVPSTVKLKPMALSLHGLLDYDISDTYEKTFEVSLFAELFNDLLKRDFASTIYSAIDLYGQRRAGKVSADPNPAKRQKFDDQPSSAEVNSTLVFFIYLFEIFLKQKLNIFFFFVAFGTC